MSAQPTNTTDALEFHGKTFIPEVTWAQRSSASEPEKNHIFLTISVPDVDPKKSKIDVQPGKLSFSGYSQSKKADYAVTLEFYADIDPAASKTNASPRAIEFVLQKKELGEAYWPRLLKDSKKVHFLKTDFDRWVDEDEQDEAPEDDDYMSRMGGMPGGMGGMGGMGGDGGFGGIDFSKLGGMGGMGGAEGLGDMDDEEGDEDDDDEMPELEGESNAEAGAASSKKIEEVE